MKKISVRTRLHELAAGHLSWVQYPQIRPIGEDRAAPFWKYKMSLFDRLCLAMVSIFGIIVFGLLVLFLGVMIWAFGSAALGF